MAHGTLLRTTTVRVSARGAAAFSALARWWQNHVRSPHARHCGLRPGGGYGGCAAHTPARRTLAAALLAATLGGMPLALVRAKRQS